METPRIRYARRDGRAIGYQTWGSAGVDCLAIGDWPTTNDALWEHPGHLRINRVHGSLVRISRFDRSGIGASDPEPGGRVGDVSAWAEDAVAVLDAVGSRRTTVVAEGWGSHAAVVLAARHPNRVERLVLANSFARLARSEDYPHGSPADAADQVVEYVQAQWGTGAVIGGVVPGLSVDESYLDFCARYERAAASPAVAAAMTRAMYTSDVRQELPRVSCPALVLYTGDYRHISRGHSQYLSTQISGATFSEADPESIYSLRDEVGRQYVEFLTGHGDQNWAERELAAVVFTDIVESTSELARQGDHRWRETLEDCHDLVEREVARFGGRVVKQTGDGHLLTFPSPGAAISAVFGIRRAAPVLGVSFRFGVHMGEVEVRDGDIAGITVHAASRITDIGESNQVLVSGVVADLLAGTGLQLVALGSHPLKGLPGEWRIFSVGGSIG